MKNLLFSISCSPATEEEIQAFESDESLRFPADLKEYYMRFNGGCPAAENEKYWVPARFTEFNSEYRDGSILVFGLFGLMPADQHFSMIKKWSFLQEMRDLPRHFIPLGDDGAGNMIFVDCSEAESGKLYFWDNETEIWYPIADRCLDFFDSLEPQA